MRPTATASISWSWTTERTQPRVRRRLSRQGRFRGGADGERDRSAGAFSPGTLRPGADGPANARDVRSRPFEAVPGAGSRGGGDHHDRVRQHRDRRVRHEGGRHRLPDQTPQPGGAAPPHRAGQAQPPASAGEHRAARGLAGTASHRGRHRRKRPDAGGAGPRAARGAERRHRPPARR